MRLNEYIDAENNTVQEQLLVEKLENDLDALMKRVNKTEFKFYCTLLGISKEEKTCLKKMKIQNRGSLRFINRNVPFGGVRKLIKAKKYKVAKSIMDDFDNNIATRKRFFTDQYPSELNNIKAKIAKNLQDDTDKQDMLKQHEELKKAQKRARVEKEKEKLEQEQQEREKQEEELVTNLKRTQETADAERLYAKQEAQTEKKEEKEAKRTAKKEEINQKRKDTIENNKKEKKIVGLVDEYKTLIQKRRALIDSTDESVDSERKKVKHDLEQLIMVAKKHEIDEGDLALRCRNYEKWSMKWMKK